MSARRSMLILVAGLIAAAAGIAIATEYGARICWRQRERIEMATGVRLPDAARDVFVFRDSLREHVWLSGYLRVPRRFIPVFIEENEFKPIDTPDLSFVFSLDRMPDRCQRVRHENAVYGVSGYTRRDELPFEFVLDAETGEVWLNVQFAK